MTMQKPFIILSTLGAKERWSAARSSFDGTSSGEEWMVVIAVIALVISVILLIWTFVKHSRTENLLRRKVSELNITNKRLQREIAEFNKELFEVLQSIIGTESPDKEVVEIGAQQIQALSALSRRLQ